MSRPLAIVTGATAPGRVGLAIACELARAGCGVILTHAPSTGADQVESAIARVMRVAPEAACRTMALELADPAACARWAALLAEECSRIDVLVHNASRYAPTPLAEVSAADLAGFFTINAATPLLITRTLAPKLAQSPMPGGGAVVTMCDAHAMGELGQTRTAHAAYSMSKAALLEATLVLARELAPSVRVNGVAPGVVAFAPTEGDSFQSRYLARVPLGRSGTPEEAAKAVRFLALEATYCTGQILRLDGGRGLT